MEKTNQNSRKAILSNQRKKRKTEASQGITIITIIITTITIIRRTIMKDSTLLGKNMILSMRVEANTAMKKMNLASIAILRMTTI
jgi:hypothetical protein